MNKRLEVEAAPRIQDSLGRTNYVAAVFEALENIHGNVLLQRKVSALKHDRPNHVASDEICLENVLTAAWS